MLLADGCSYEEIGTRLFISLNTVKFHVRSIFVRLGVRNRMAAARLLVRHRGLAAPTCDTRRSSGVRDLTLLGANHPQRQGGHHTKSRCLPHPSRPIRLPQKSAQGAHWGKPKRAAKSS